MSVPSTGAGGMPIKAIYTGAVDVEMMNDYLTATILSVYKTSSPRRKRIIKRGNNWWNRE